MHPRLLLAAVVVSAASTPVAASSAAATSDATRVCATHVLPVDHARVDRDVVERASRIEITDYLPGGSYRVTRCDANGRLERAAVADPVRLPDGKVTTLPSQLVAGSLMIDIDHGDLRLYRGDWRAAVAEAKKALLQPADVSKLTRASVPVSRDEAAVAAQARVAKTSAAWARLVIHRGRPLPPRPRRVSAHASAQYPCSQGDYVYGYWGRKTSSVHALNLGQIGEAYRSDFVNAINEGFNTWQYTYNTCSFAALNAVGASTSGFTLATTTDDYGSTWNNNGFDLVDAGPLSYGGCAGAIACTARVGGSIRDVRLSTAYPYCVGWCPGQYDIWSTVAHEAGHVYGFNHASDSSQVMYAYANTNDASKRYLWYGDYSGLSFMKNCGC